MINLFVKFAYLAFFKRLRKPTGPRPSYVEWFNTILSDKKQQIPHHLTLSHLLFLLAVVETIPHPKHNGEKNSLDLFF